MASHIKRVFNVNAVSAPVTWRFWQGGRTFRLIGWQMTGQPKRRRAFSPKLMPVRLAPPGRS